MNPDRKARFEFVIPALESQATAMPGSRAQNVNNRRREL
jgi:hypothetical protein